MRRSDPPTRGAPHGRSSVRGAAYLGAWLVFVGLGWTTHPLPAQTLQGVVTIAGTDSVLAGAQVRLIPLTIDTALPDVLPVARSGLDGQFLLRVPGPGRYMLQARTIGYRPQFMQIEFGSNTAIAIRINLRPSITNLEAITVWGLRTSSPELAAFEKRRQNPWGYTLGMQEIQALGVETVEQLKFAIPWATGVRICYRTYIDGRVAHEPGWYIRDFPARSLFGVEFYRSYFDIPVRYRDPLANPGCGALMLWTRQVETGKQR